MRQPDDTKDIGAPNDRWRPRRTLTGYERCGVWFPEGFELPENLDWFLRLIGHSDPSPFPTEYPDRPEIYGKKRALLDARLRRLWALLEAPDRLVAMTPVLRQIQPVWRARAITFLPVTEDERVTLRGRWCRDSDPAFPKPKTVEPRTPERYLGPYRFVKGRLTRL